MEGMPCKRNEIHVWSAFLVPVYVLLIASLTYYYYYYSLVMINIKRLPHRSPLTFAAMSKTYVFWSTRLNETSDKLSLRHL